MKKQLKNGSGLIALCLMMLFGLRTDILLAQSTIWPVNYADNNVATTFFAAPDWLNVSEFTNSNGTLYTEVWDEGPGNGCYMEVHDNIVGSTPTTIQLGAALPNLKRHPDVILGGDANNNYVAAVYTYYNTLTVTNIRLEVYTVTGMGGVITLNACGTYIFPITNLNVNAHARDAHIDIANIFNAGGVKADIITIAWEELSVCGANGGYGARACAASLSALAGTGCNNPSFTFSGCLNNVVAPDAGEQVDVAVRYNPSIPGYEAGFTFMDLNGNVDAGKWDITNNIITLGTAIDAPGVGNGEYPRIDVNDEVVPFSPAMDAEIVYRYLDGNGFWNVMSLNNILTPGNEEISSYDATGTFVSNNTKPVVTCGNNNNINAALNNFFSVAYANPTTGIDAVYVQDIDWTNGLCTQVVPGYYDYYPTNFNATIDGPVAIASDWIYDVSTTATIKSNEIYTCWINKAGTPRIDCKTTLAIPPQFRPTGINNSHTINSVQISPNPATNKLYLVQGSKGIRSYSINNLLGQTVLKGENIAKGKEVVDITKLSPGTYVIKVLCDDKTIENSIFTKY